METRNKSVLNLKGDNDPYTLCPWTYITATSIFNQLKNFQNQEYIYIISTPRVIQRVWPELEESSSLEGVE